MDFFSPLQSMRLLEVVRGARTANEVIASSMQLARRIGKLAVVSRAAEGFIARRAMRRCFLAANELVLAGSAPQDIDEAMNILPPEPAIQPAGGINGCHNQELSPFPDAYSPRSGATCRHLLVRASKRRWAASTSLR